MSAIPGGFGLDYRRSNVSLGLPFGPSSSHFLSFPRRSLSFRSKVKASLDFSVSLKASWGSPSISVNEKETPEAYIIKADVRGFKKDEVKVEVENGRVIQISGEKIEEEEEEEVKSDTTERSSDKFVRRFQLPKNAEVDQITAAMQDEMLTVITPKLKKPVIRTIEISG